MQFYTVKKSQVGEGVEATVLYHKDNGDELVCVRTGFEAFEEQNQEAEQITQEDADQLLADAAVVVSVPVKQEIRSSDNKRSQEDILQEIQNEETPTVDITTHEETDAEGNKIQKLTYYEEKEIKSVEDFLKAQVAQTTEPEQVVVPNPELTDTKESDTSSSNNN